MSEAVRDTGGCVSTSFADEEIIKRRDATLHDVRSANNNVNMIAVDPGLPVGQGSHPLDRGGSRPPSRARLPSTRQRWIQGSQYHKTPIH